MKDWESVRAQYYGWFLSLLDSRLLVERGREVVRECLGQDLVAQYTRENISSGEKCHCTAQFVRKAQVDQVDPVETERLGEVSRLIIAGFIITPRTFGARVILTPSQLELYKQNDLEPFSVASQSGQSKNLPPQSDRLRPDWEPSGAGSLEEVEGGQCSVLDLLGDVKGRRAHITLGCLGPTRPVQTGLDQLEVLRRLEECEDLEAGTRLVSLGQGCWLLPLTSPLSVYTVFTGSY